MAKRTADLSTFMVRSGASAAPAPLPLHRVEEPSPRRLQKKTCQMTPEAVRTLAILKAENGRKENELVAEAMNMLFLKYGKPQVA